MNLTPIQSSSPTPQEPERTRSERRAADRAGSKSHQTEAVKARGLAHEISQRLKALRADAENRKARVGAVLEEIRQEELLTREQLERAAESILFGEDPESIPLE